MTTLTNDTNKENNDVGLERVPRFLVGKPLQDRDAGDENVSTQNFDSYFQAGARCTSDSLQTLLLLAKMPSRICRQCQLYLTNTCFNL